MIWDSILKYFQTQNFRHKIIVFGKQWIIIFELQQNPINRPSNYRPCCLIGHNFAQVFISSTVCQSLLGVFQEFPTNSISTGLEPHLVSPSVPHRDRSWSHQRFHILWYLTPKPWQRARCFPQQPIWQLALKSRCFPQQLIWQLALKAHCLLPKLI